VSDLPKPDLLHTMQIGILDYLLKWFFHYMNMHKRLDKYNAICLSVPAYHDLTPENMSYVDVSQLNRKEMKSTSQYQLGIVPQCRHDESHIERLILNCAFEFTWALLEILYVCSI